MFGLDTITLGAVVCAVITFLYWYLGDDMPSFLQRWEGRILCEDLKKSRRRKAEQKLREEVSELHEGSGGSE